MADPSVRTSFFSKNAVECPVCETSFYREELLTGRGRLIAGALTQDLRRMYEPSRKFGEVFPLIYPITVCPGCYYSAFQYDFPGIDAKTRHGIEAGTDGRIGSVQHLFEELDFREPRRLQEGAASYYFALMSYDHFPKEASPVMKKAICSLRAAWLFSDLHRQLPGENYDYVAILFYRKARFFYTLSLEYEQNGQESAANVPHLGPDIDKNFGYDGLLYLSSYLELHYGPRENEEKRRKSLEQAKTSVARLFGMGKASKQKPSVILDKARSLYDEIAGVLKDGTEAVEDERS